MNRTEALKYVGHALDDALAVRTGEPIPTHARLVGWQCDFEPMFVAVWSYLPDSKLSDDEAEEIAADYLAEIGWFVNEPTSADYIV